jgi:hypothetical protein
VTPIVFAAGRRLGRRKFSASFFFSVLRVEHICDGRNGRPTEIGFRLDGTVISLVGSTRRRP